jgi:2-keto-4-pentenoate hydratase
VTADAGAEEIIARCAAELYGAESSRCPTEPLTGRFPRLTVPEAYRIQQANIERRMALGERVVGHKIGLTAKAMQEMFGVSEPDYGHLLDTMMHDERAPLDLSALIDPQIEVEPAFVLGSRLKGPDVAVADVLAATDHIRVCFEVIDSRIIDWQVRLQDTVADNGSSARVVLGSRKADPRDLELDDLETELELDGVVVETGNTSAILGHPANGIAWLANRISEFGLTLDAGHVVLPGTCTRCVRIGGHRRVAGRIEGLGEVTLHLSGSPSVPNKRRVDGSRS